MERYRSFKELKEHDHLKIAEKPVFKKEHDVMDFITLLKKFSSGKAVRKGPQKPKS